MICDSRFHRGRDFKALMHTAEVEKGHVQMNRGGQMFERLTETETQSRKAAKVRPHAEIRSFDVARRIVPWCVPVTRETARTLIPSSKSVTISVAVSVEM